MTKPKKILRNFGYDDRLEIKRGNFLDKLTNVRPGASIELSERALLFLRKIFSMNSNNGMDLQKKELESIFYPYPSNHTNNDLNKMESQ